MHTRLDEYFSAKATRTQPTVLRKDQLKWVQEGIVEGDSPFYREANDKHGSKHVVLDPGKNPRKPIGASKFTGLLEHLDSWSAWPKRSRSVIMSLSGKAVPVRAAMFGDSLYRVWPEDGARVVIAPSKDINLSIFTAFPKLGAVLAEPAYEVMQSIPDKIMKVCRRRGLYDFAYEMGVYCLDDLVTQPEKLLAAYDVAAELKVDDESEVEHPEMNNIIRMIREAGGANKMFSDLLHPVGNGFKLIDVKDVYDNLPETGRECWTDGVCTLEMVHKMHKKGGMP